MTTLLELKTRAIQLADMDESLYVSDSQWTSFIVSGIRGLYDQVVSSYEDYFIATPVAFSLSVTNSLPLPADFYKARSVLRKYGDVERELDYIDFGMKDKCTKLSYTVFGDNLYVFPSRGIQSGDYVFWYVQDVTVPTVDADVINPQLTKHGWDDYIIYHAVELALGKEETDAGWVIKLKAECEARIKKMAQNRQVQQSKRIEDVQRSNRIYDNRDEEC